MIAGLTRPPWHQADPIFFTPIMSTLSRRWLALHHQVLLGLGLGIAAGMAANLYGFMVDELLSKLVGQPVAFLPPLLTYVIDPVGQIYLRLLLVTVVPLVFTSLAIGVSRLDQPGQLGRMGARTLLYFLATTAVALAMGLGLASVFQPGICLPQETRDTLLIAYRGQLPEAHAGAAPFGIEMLVNVFPRNLLRAAVDMDMLPIIAAGLVTGLALTRMAGQRKRAVLLLLEAVGDVLALVIRLALWATPYAAFALLFTATARFGLGILRPLGLYVGVVLLGLAIYLFGVLPILIRGFSSITVSKFFRITHPVLVTALSTSSSSATLPAALKAAEDGLGIPVRVAGFVMSLGTMLNKNGTALFEGVTVVFLAQAFGIPLTLSMLGLIAILTIVASVGAAAIPSGGFPMLMMMLAAVGVPAEGIAIIIGVDRLLDMCRTVVNVAGNLTVTVCMAYSNSRQEPIVPAPCEVEGPPPQKAPLENAS